MNEGSFQQRTLTLMFTDIVGYSRLMELDQSQTISMLEDYRRILVEQIEKQQGIVIEFVGDAVFARFDTPKKAVCAAIIIQKELFTFNHFRDKSLPRLQTRIGIHAGDVATKGNAVFGDNVNIAARLEPIAVADGICISKSVYDAVKNELKEPILSLGVQPLKNIESKIRAYLIRPLGITFKTRAHYCARKFNQKVGACRYPIVASLAIAIISLFYLVPRWLVPGYDANYVEISAFQNLTNESGDADYLGLGITEAVRSQLADVRDVYLLKTSEDILAPIVLEGSVQKVGNNLRIGYQLIRRQDSTQIAGGKLDGAYEDIFILQDRVVAEIAQHLAEEFNLPNFRPAKVDITADLLAYDFYMKGLGHLSRPSTQAVIDEAINFFTTALVHDREFALANAALCQSYWRKYNLTEIVELLKKAEAYCELALAQDSSSRKAAESMGIIYRETGRFPEAIKILENLLVDDPENAQVIATLSNVYGLSGRVDEAELILKQALSKNPKNWELHQALGLLYYRGNHIREAIKSYKKVVKLTPGNAAALNNLGSCYLLLGDFRSAAKAFAKSVALVPSSWGLSNTGTMYYFSGNYERAIQMYQQALRLAPEDFRSYVNMGDVLRQIPDKGSMYAGFYGKAINLALQVLEVNPEDLEATLHLAHAYHFEGDSTSANKYIDKALQIAPDEPNVLYLKMKMLFFNDENALAIEYLSKLLKDGYFLSFIQADPDLQNFNRQPQVSKILASM